jgi:hypothetical protein
MNYVWSKKYLKTTRLANGDKKKRMKNFTTGPLERCWNCRIHLRGRCQLVDRCLFDAGVSLERAGWVPLLEMQVRLEEEHRLFVQLAFTRSERERN